MQSISNFEDYYIVALVGRLEIVEELYDQIILPYISYAHFIYYILYESGAHNTLDIIISEFGLAIDLLEKNTFLILLDVVEIPMILTYLTAIINAFKTELEYINIQDVVELLDEHEILNHQEEE